MTSIGKYIKHKWKRDKVFRRQGMKICKRCQRVRQPQTPRHIGDSVYYRAKEGGLFDCINIGDDPGCPTDLEALDEYKAKRNAEMEVSRNPIGFTISGGYDAFITIAGDEQ